MGGRGKPVGGEQQHPVAVLQPAILSPVDDRARRERQVAPFAAGIGAPADQREQRIGIRQHYPGLAQQPAQRFRSLQGMTAGSATVPCDRDTAADDAARGAPVQQVAIAKPQAVAGADRLLVFQTVLVQSRQGDAGSARPQRAATQQQSLVEADARLVCRQLENAGSLEIAGQCHGRTQRRHMQPVAVLERLAACLIRATQQQGIEIECLA